MPELPEVETVRRGLDALLQPPVTVTGLQARRADLRWPLPDLSPCAGMRIVSLQRIGKYLIFVGERFSILNHLGMTGSWRELSGPPE
ncbi:MAG: DNA-formamidopyrimidine glycosylase family protein, partial [Planctomycetota bacterium]